MLGPALTRYSAHIPYHLLPRQVEWYCGLLSLVFLPLLVIMIFPVLLPPQPNEFQMPLLQDVHEPKHPNRMRTGTGSVRLRTNDEIYAPAVKAVACAFTSNRNTNALNARVLACAFTTGSVRAAKNAAVLEFVSTPGRGGDVKNAMPNPHNPIQPVDEAKGKKDAMQQEKMRRLMPA
jgi:hypothetical protein